MREEEQLEAGQPYSASNLRQLISTRKRYRNFTSMIRRIHPELKEEHSPESHITIDETTQLVDTDLSTIFEPIQEGEGDHNIANTRNLTAQEIEPDSEPNHQDLQA